MKYFWQGLTMGLAYVAPIGMQNLFVINSALTHTRRRALINAFIVIYFDVTLALACFFGAGAVIQRYEWIRLLVLAAGSLIVIYIGIGLLRSKEEKLEKTEVSSSILKTISSACIVTWFNPQAIIDGTMMLGAFHASLPVKQAASFVSGVAASSCIWFTGLTLVVSVLGRKINERVLWSINRVCGIVIIFYGVRLFLDFISLLI